MITDIKFSSFEDEYGIRKYQWTFTYNGKKYGTALDNRVTDSIGNIIMIGEEIPDEVIIDFFQGAIDQMIKVSEIDETKKSFTYIDKEGRTRPFRRTHEDYKREYEENQHYFVEQGMELNYDIEQAFLNRSADNPAKLMYKYLNLLRLELSALKRYVLGE